MSIQLDLMRIRIELSDAGFKKNGWNDFSKFTYFELEDIQPSITRKLEENGMYDRFSYNIIDGKEVYTLTIFKGEEKEEFHIPFKHFTPPSKMQEVQQAGATNTYLKKYLYMNAFNITESDPVDGREQGDAIIGHWQQKVLNEINKRSLDISVFAKQYGLTEESPEERFKFVYNLAFNDSQSKNHQKQPQPKVWQQRVIDALLQNSIDVNTYFRDQGLTVNSPEERFQSIYQTKIAPITASSAPQSTNNYQQASGSPFG